MRAQTESLAAQFTDVDSRLDSQANPNPNPSPNPKPKPKPNPNPNPKPKPKPNPNSNPNPNPNQAGRLWGECARRRYDFERPWRSADKVRRLTREKLLAFFDRHLADGSPTRRQLSTHVYSQAIAPKASELVVEPVGDLFFDPPPDMLVV